MIGLLLALAGALAAVQEEATSRPNVVLFYADDLGWRDVGFAGSAFYETPHLDRLAREGLVFTDAYSNGPNCAPSRACLMSGLWTPRHGVYTVGSAARGKAKNRALIPIENRTDLAPEHVTLAEALGAAGYATCHVGKWHLGDDPRAQGFDVNVGGLAAGSPPGGHFAPYRNAALADGPEGEYLTDRLTDEAIAFLREERSQPFFLYLAHYAVHTPIQAPEELTERFADKPADGGQRNAKYAGMVASLDASLGRIRTALDELGLADNTVVLFTSDNGGHGPVTSMAPLRGAKGMLYEGGIRVPLVALWPGRTAAGTRCAEPVSGLDLYPTLLAVTGASAPEGWTPDGANLVPLLGGAAELGREALFWHFPAYLQATGKGGAGPWRTTPASAVRAGRYKLLEFYEDGRLELYDLAQDPGEERDLAAERPELRDELHARLSRWRERTAAPVPTERNPKYAPR
ncbi:MAG: sulfatase [Planctomycetota bacterium]